jgi:hypothetical protein
LDNWNAAGRNQRHLMVETIPRRLGVLITDLPDRFFQQDKRIAVIVNQSFRHTRGVFR